jgi:alpha-galactosidase
MTRATARPAALARHETAGRLSAVRLGLRYSDDATAPREEDGSVGALSFAEGRLVPGSQRLGPFVLRLAADTAGDVLRFEVVARNEGPAPAYLESVVLGLRWSGPTAAGLRFLRHGWQSWSFTGSTALDADGAPAFPSGDWLRGFHHGVNRPPGDRAGWHESDLVTAVGVAPTGPCCVAGVLERGQATSLVYARRDGEDVRIEVELRLEVPIQPGEERTLEPVRFALGDEASRLLEEHAAAHGRESDARTAAPFQAGWCTWYHYFHDVTEEIFLRNLEALAALRAEIPIEVVQLDDGYQRAIGDWLETNEKFPRGIAPLAGAIRDAGFRPGIWTAPFCVAPESRLFSDHRDWLLRRGDELHRGLLHPMWSKEASIYVLDTSRDDVCAHLLRTFAALAGMGFGYLKLDFLYAAAMQARARDASVTRAARLRRGLDAVRAGAGEDAFLLGCGCPLGPAVGVVDGMRIGPDVAPYWHVDPGTAIPGIEATVPSTRNALRNVVNRAWMHRRLWLNDPDCLMARTRDTKLTQAEVKSLAASIAVTGGMVIFSDDVPDLSPEERARVRETVELAREVDAAAASGTARAVGLLSEEIAPIVAAGTGAGTLIALLNDAEEPRELELPFAELEKIATTAPEAEPPPLLGTAPARWDEAGLSARLGPHETSLVRLGRPPALAVFCDFDGTFAVQDVGATLARRYAGERREALWPRLSRGELEPWEYNLELLDGLALPEEELESFLQSVELSPGAAELVAWCEERGLPFRVLSDGFDRNLDRLQEIHGVRFEYDANGLRYEDGVWRISAGSPDAGCGCGTGVCKRARIRAFRAAHPGTVVVHVGNGRVSDLCAALAADVVFAKDTLADELRERGLGFEPFGDLREVLAGCERLLARLEPEAAAGQ